MNEAFYFVQQGQTDFSDDLLTTCQNDPPLNDTGCLEAKAIGGILASQSLSTLCFSKATSAAQTAQMIAIECPCSLHMIEKLSGRFMGSLKRDLVTYGLIVNEEYDQSTEAEPLELFRERVIQGIEEAFSLPDPIVIVSDTEIYEIICLELGLEPVSFLNTEVAYLFLELGKWNLKIIKK